MCYSSLTLEGLDMANTTTIEWTDATWNPVTGCTKISKGCDNCYAERFSERFRGTPGHPFEAGSDLTLRPVKRSDSNFLSISVNDANYLRLRPIFVLDVLLDVFVRRSTWLASHSKLVLPLWKSVKDWW
jgi:protein gp37